MPLSVTLDQVLPRGNHFVLFLACSPITARRCRSFIWNARTYQLEPEADAGLAAFQATIFDQARPIAESHRPEELQVDLSAELRIAGPDRASIAYRRRRIQGSTITVNLAASKLPDAGSGPISVGDIDAAVGFTVHGGDAGCGTGLGVRIRT